MVFKHLNICQEITFESNNVNYRGQYFSSIVLAEEAGRVEFNVTTPTLRNRCIQRTEIHKQNSFKVTSMGVQG